MKNFPIQVGFPSSNSDTLYMEDAMAPGTYPEVVSIFFQDYRPYLRQGHTACNLADVEQQYCGICFTRTNGCIFFLCYG